MVTVIPIDNNISNCFIPICIENVLSQYLEYIKYEYQYAFAKYMKLKFDKEKSLKTGRVADGMSTYYNFVEALYSIYGVNIKRTTFNCVDKLLDYVKKNISYNLPVIINLDSYFLPWSTLFNLQHTGHVVLVIDMNQSNDSILILDTIEKQNYFWVTKDILINACKFVWEVNLPSVPKQVNDLVFDSKVIKGEIDLIPKDRIDFLKDFAKTFSQIFEPNIEFRDKYNLDLMRTEKLVDDIRKIILQINIFCKWLLWRDDKADVKNFVSVVEAYKQVMSKWNVFINLLYKNCLLGWKESFSEEGYRILLQIIEIEEYAYDLFFECIEKKNTTRSKHVLASAKGRYYKISLQNYYNNKGFCIKEKSRGVEDLTGVGEYFIIDEKNPDKKDFFVLPDFDGSFDNIVCKGQEILINSDELTNKIAIVACAEWGAVDEKIIIIGDEEQKISIHVHDMSEGDLCDVYCKGTTCNLSGDVVQENAAIYKYSFDYQKTKVTKIILPDSPNLHIIAMTLIA